MKKRLKFRYTLLGLIFLALVILAFGIFFWRQTEVALSNSDKDQGQGNVTDDIKNQIIQEEEDIITSSSTLDEPEKETTFITSANNNPTEEQLIDLFLDYQRFFVENNRELIAKRVAYPLEDLCMLSEEAPKTISNEAEFLEHFESIFRESQRYLFMNTDISREITDDTYEFSTITEYGKEILSLRKGRFFYSQPDTLFLSIQNYIASPPGDSEAYGRSTYLKVVPEGNYDTGYLELDSIKCSQ